jgi:hypothetical protein
MCLFATSWYRWCFVKLNIITIFNTSIQYISENAVPTIHAVILIKRILAQLEIEETDNEIIKILKVTLKQNVEKYFKIHLIHKIAIFTIQN